jgi:hypothetical protein
MKKVHLFALSLVAVVVVMIQPAARPSMASPPGTVLCIPNFTAALPAKAALPVLQPQEVTDPVVITTTFGDILKANWLEILLAIMSVAGIVIRLTPSKTDDTILAWIMKVINLFFPNRATNGTIHGPTFKAQQK